MFKRRREDDYADLVAADRRDNYDRGRDDSPIRSASGVVRHRYGYLAV
jgi:hypothetical protein